MPATGGNRNRKWRNVRADRAEGDTLATLARRYNITHDTAARWCADIHCPNSNPPLPSRPLIDYLNRQRISVSEVHRLCGIARGGRVGQALATGRINSWMADRIACRLGVHPTAIWGDLWWTSITNPNRQHDIDGVA